ncbi:MAG TPA: GGDEF domain-containing protein [Thermoanaerobaculia bacterium]|nr:GGDEF domain-containing protein [Thermoanaerobaculia bacterium]
MRDSSTDGIQIGGLPTELTIDGPTLVDQARPDEAAVGYEAAVILISHPENRRLGARFRLAPGSTLEIGRAANADISLPEAPSLSRHHVRVRLANGQVTLEDLGSRNGTFINDRAIRGAVELKSGDRFQLGNVHFKFLHEKDVEHAYYEAIYEMVVRDGLTGIFNRRKFFEEGARELARAQRHGRALSFVLLDLDHFKRVNDELGHLAGDSALKQVTQRLLPLVRTEELFARIGGEEFAVLCPETDLERALVLAEKMRRLCGSESYDCGGAEVSITCSIGVAELAPEMSRLEDLLRAADRALYVAKNEGRDRVRAAARVETS